MGTSTEELRAELHRQITGLVETNLASLAALLIEHVAAHSAKIVGDQIRAELRARRLPDVYVERIASSAQKLIRDRFAASAREGFERARAIGDRQSAPSPTSASPGGSTVH